MNWPAILKPLVLPAKYDGLSVTARRLAREEYARRQDGKCWYCGERLIDAPGEKGQKPTTAKLFPVGFFDWPVHLHHDHQTGLTVGAVHAICNAVLAEHEGQ